jgi:DNA-3-methyladenine glycosylase
VSGSPLPDEFYARDTESVARAVLGCVLETRVEGERTAGRIVEVEAYLGPDDPAAHGYRNRRTGGNAALYGPPGTAYVYRSYGVHWCFNAVTEREDFPSAVLVRALEPTVGLATMGRRRGTDQPRLFCAGPGRLCQALGIAGDHDGGNLATGAVRLLRSSDAAPVTVAAGPRIGISKATDWPLRFVERGSPWLSRRA